MIRGAALLLAALTLLTAPALAQESAEDAPPSADSSEPAAESTAEATPAEDAADEPAPMLPPAPAIPPPSPFSPDQRGGWLAQCRSTFLRAGAALGGGNGLPDACEAQLLGFERSYVPAADGTPPVIWVRVPVARQPAVPDSDDNAADAVESPAE